MLLALFAAGCAVETPFYRDPGEASAPPAGKYADHTVYLIGDAGESIKGLRETAFTALIQEASEYPERSTIVFLGDNVYPKGMPAADDPERKRSEFYLDEQLAVAEATGAETIFIPGNHDWNLGLESVRDQVTYIEEQALENVEFIPDPGCPGPEVMDVTSDIRMVILDSEWLLAEGLKGTEADPVCGARTYEAVLDSLAAVFDASGGKQTIFVMHHPLLTYGMHGGFFDWKVHLFPLRELNDALWLPLPVVGSLYPLIRSMGVNRQDIMAPLYKELRRDVEAAFGENPPIATASGHEHVLQVLKDPAKAYHYLVSGRGTSLHDDVVTDGEHTLYADDRSGYMKIEFYGGIVRLVVIVPDEEGGPVATYSKIITD